MSRIFSLMAMSTQVQLGGVALECNKYHMTDVKWAEVKEYVEKDNMSHITVDIYLHAEFSLAQVLDSPVLYKIFNKSYSAHSYEWNIHPDSNTSIASVLDYVGDPNHLIRLMKERKFTLDNSREFVRVHDRGARLPYISYDVTFEPQSTEVQALIKVLDEEWQEWENRKNCKTENTENECNDCSCECEEFPDAVMDDYEDYDCSCGCDECPHCGDD